MFVLLLLLLLLLLYHLPRSALRRVFWRCFCHFCSDLRNNFMSNLAIFPSWIEWMKWICGTYFFGFGVPVFAVVDIWLDKTTKRHPLRIYTFCQYIVCRKLCPAGCEEDTGNSTVFLLWIRPRLKVSVLCNASRVRYADTRGFSTEIAKIRYI